MKIELDLSRDEIHELNCYINLAFRDDKNKNEEGKKAVHLWNQTFMKAISR